jgi:DNA-binding NarL/FixJ family response regulator
MHRFVMTKVHDPTHFRRDKMRPLVDRSHSGVPATALTVVQRQIVGLVAEGLPNQSIADRLGVARTTVSGHIATILWRLGLTSRSQIALWALTQDCGMRAPSP